MIWIKGYSINECTDTDLVPTKSKIRAWFRSVDPDHEPIISLRIWYKTYYLEKASLHSENFNQMEPVEKHWNDLSDKMSQRGTYLNAEKEKLQLKHEENEFKEQIQLLRDRLEHFGDPQDENSGIFTTSTINRKTFSTNRNTFNTSQMRK